MSAQATTARIRIRSYIELTKPRITLLVLVTAYTGMWMAAGGAPAPGLVFWTLLGTAMAAASSSTLNNYIDREVDVLMARTRGRALATGRVQAAEALWLGLGLGAAAFAVLLWQVNLLTALLAVATIAFYVGIYTRWLKRTTPLCTAIGGIPGAAPPLIGWAAVSGEIGAMAWLLFGIMFLWQPPHFWALAMIRADEYKAAGLPMLPVVKSARRTKLHMLGWTAALLPASLVPGLVGLTGPFYLAAAATLGAVYMGKTIAFARRPITPARARSLFFFSIAYLFVLFVAMFLDFQGTAALV